MPWDFEQNKNGVLFKGAALHSYILQQYIKGQEPDGLAKTVTAVPSSTDTSKTKVTTNRLFCVSLKLRHGGFGSEDASEIASRRRGPTDPHRLLSDTWH